MTAAIILTRGRIVESACRGVDRVKALIEMQLKTRRGSEL
jgi:hypothetical protein